MRFHVGDKVRALPNDEYVITTDGWVGYVTEVDDDFIWVRENSTSENFGVWARYFELIEPAHVKEKEENLW